MQDKKIRMSRKLWLHQYDKSLVGMIASYSQKMIY